MAPDSGYKFKEYIIYMQIRHIKSPGYLPLCPLISPYRKWQYTESLIKCRKGRFLHP